MGATKSRAELLGTGGTLGVVLIHDIYGRGPYVRSVAEALVAAGIPTAAVDLFGGKTPASVEEGREIAGTLTDEGVLAVLEEARGELAGRLTGPARVGTLGFCMGGGYALLGACHRPFDFAVDYYGKIAHVEDVSGLRGPVLVLLGSEDERITPWALTEFMPAALRAKKRVSLELYPGVRHAFHRPGWEGHDPAAAADAWRRTLDFLSDVRAVEAPRSAQS
ncbi:MAG TPA: dienelactone hydrolase family protein [Thermoplasmata archaeon]|nr:dienelactone hydrolase family protein [Thermoplasmata archaeon]